MSNTDRLSVFVSNDNLIEITELKNEATGAWLNAATVTFTLVDSSGADVTDATGISMSYVAGSDGTYRGTLVDTVSLTATAKYTAEITANAGTGLQGFWVVPVRAETRQE